eukprot:SAG31_NODE_194_length_20722_cov_19.854192_18_plen_104_part_00
MQLTQLRTGAERQRSNRLIEFHWTHQTSVHELQPKNRSLYLRSAPHSTSRLWKRDRQGRANAVAGDGKQFQSYGGSIYTGNSQFPLAKSVATIDVKLRKQCRC